MDDKCCLCGRTGHLAKDCKWRAGNDPLTDQQRHILLDMIEASGAGVKAVTMRDELCITSMRFTTLMNGLTRAGLAWCVGGKTSVSRWVCNEVQAKRAAAVIASHKTRVKKAAVKRKVARAKERRELVRVESGRRWPRVASVFELANYI